MSRNLQPPLGLGDAWTIEVGPGFATLACEPTYVAVLNVRRDGARRFKREGGSLHSGTSPAAAVSGLVAYYGLCDG